MGWRQGDSSSKAATWHNWRMPLRIRIFYILLAIVTASVVFFGLFVTLGKLVPPEAGLVHIGPGRDAHIISLAKDDSGALYAGASNGDLYRRTGTTFWHRVEAPAGVTGVTALVTRPGLTAATANGSWRIADDGSWRRLSDGLPEHYRASSLLTAADGGLYLASDDSVWYSRDGRSGWQPLPTEGLPGSVRLYRLFAHQGGLLAGTSGHGLLRFSADRWSDDSSGLPAASNVFALQPLPDGGLLLGTDHGAFYRSAQEHSWQVAGAGLRGLRVTALALAGEGEATTLWAGGDAALYRLPLSELGEGGAWRSVSATHHAVAALLVDDQTLQVASGQVFEYRIWPAIRGWHFIIALLAAGTVYYIISRRPRRYLAQQGK